MTYAEFLLLFIAPLLLTTVLLAGQRIGRNSADRRLWRQGLTVLALLLIAAWLWTTPWDSWIIRHGVWSYPQGRVLATMFRVPAEEYLFMAGQTLAVGLWTLWVLDWGRSEPAVPTAGVWHRAVFTVVWAAAAAAGMVLVLHSDHGTYLGTMLLWFAPLIVVQQAVGGDILWARRRVHTLALAPTLAYLWVADRIAISLGIWAIAPERTYGIKLLGLPAEEALFFAVTNLLVVNGLVLAVDQQVHHRLRLVWPRASAPSCSLGQPH